MMIGTQGGPDAGAACGAPKGPQAVAQRDRSAVALVRFPQQPLICYEVAAEWANEKVFHRDDEKLKYCQLSDGGIGNIGKNVFLKGQCHEICFTFFIKKLHLGPI